MTLQVEDWSEEYLIVHGIEVDQHNSDHALMDEDLYWKLASWMDEPIVGFIGGIHYEMMPSSNVLADRVAVPSQNHVPDDSMAFLLAR